MKTNKISVIGDLGRECSILNKCVVFFFLDSQLVFPPSLHLVFCLSCIPAQGKDTACHFWLVS